MAYNTYSPFGQGMGGYQQYANPVGYQQYAQPVMQPQMVQPQVQDVPFTEVRFGTLDEAKAYIVPPTKSVMFINKDLDEFYVKSADNMGKPTLERFGYSKLDDTDNAPKNNVGIDTSAFIKRDELKDIATKSDLVAINEKMSALESKINKANKISELLSGKSAEDKG